MLNPHTSSFFASLEYSGSGQYSHRGMPTPLTPARGISVFDLSSAACCAMAAQPTSRKIGGSPRKRRCREDGQKFMERSVSWRAFKKESFLVAESCAVCPANSAKLLRLFGFYLPLCFGGGK